MGNKPVNQDILDSFHLIFDNHPGPAMLLQRNRDIVAVNATGQQLGIASGGKCFALIGNTKVCDHCLADKALAEGKAMRLGFYTKVLGSFMDCYWTPLAGADKLYVHYVNNISEFVRPELMAAQTE